MKCLILNYIVFIFVANLTTIICWDSEELEIFDLVEEVNANFYTLLEVEQNVEAKEIRQAFRKLSLILHPDKNDAEDAEIKFRQLVAVYEVLRDPGKRKRYDDVLVNGLPDWRQAVYYYRRVRKMGLAEMSVILFIIISIGQYLVGWASYLEKKFIMEEYITVERKRLLKKQRKGKLEGDLPEMPKLPTPSVTNTLPFQIPKLIWSCILFLPYSIKLIKEYLSELKMRKELEESSEEEEVTEQENYLPRGPRRRKNFTIPEVKESSTPAPSISTTNVVDSPEVGNEERKPVSGGLWTDDDFAELIKLVNKFPPCTNKRWEKVASAMGRTVGEVTHMAKKIKEGMVAKTSEPPEEEVEEPKKVKTKGGKLGNQIEGLAEKEWSQLQQKALEDALTKYPKQTLERWEKISKSVPGKTKEECIIRYKQLAERVKKKKDNELDSF